VAGDGVPFLVDTNTVIYARDDTAAVLKKFAEKDGEIVLSALSFAELQRGMHIPSEGAALRRARLDVLLKRIPVLPFDAAAAREYGRILAQLGWVRGRDFDRMIAAHAIATASILVTNNVADFRDIPGLQLEDWA
jgi:tRNA(fMet)-specific endonuclease VapC